MSLLDLLDKDAKRFGVPIRVVMNGQQLTNLAKEAGYDVSLVDEKED